MPGVKVVKPRWMSCLLALAFLCAQHTAFAAADVPAAAQPEQAVSPVLEKPITLTPSALVLAQQLGIAENIRRVDELRSSPNNIELLQQKQAIMQAVMVGMLEVRAATAQISNDMFEAGQIRTVLENRRDRGLKVNSIANFVSGGVSELGGGSFQLVPNMKLDNAGNIVEMVGGAMQMGLSTYALKQQGGQKKRTPVRANMLAPIFDQSTNGESKYPRVVWKFLNAQNASGESLRQTLVKQWLESGKLAGRETAYIAALTGNGGTRYPVNIDILESRQIMLSDVGAIISRIDRLLLELLLYSDVPAA